MSSVNYRSSVSSATGLPSSLSLVKRTAPAENASRATAVAGEQAKKRVALGNITNLSSAGRNPSWSPGTNSANRSNAASLTLTAKKGSVTRSHYTGLPHNHENTTSVVKPTTIIPSGMTCVPKNDGLTTSVSAFIVPCRTTTSSNHSRDSISLDESMSTCDSMKGPNFEYIDNTDLSLVLSLERQATDNLHISEQADSAGYTWKKGVPMAMETTNDIVEIDSNRKDPQFWATLACGIYQHLRIVEMKRRPSTDFLERIQGDINASMCAILIDWLVEVAEKYCFVPDTLYLTVNYIDLYLSGNEVNRQQLQLLGVACMLIPAKYEETCAPQVEEFCYITDNTYFKDEILQMEVAVLKYLKFEMTAQTVKCFLRGFVCAGQNCDEDSLQGSQLQMEFLASYLAELSLLEYGFLFYSPSLIAASSVFLAKFILQPTKKPWNATLSHYTLYRPSELCKCVKAFPSAFLQQP